MIMSQNEIRLRSKMNLRIVSQPMTAREINVVEIINTAAQHVREKESGAVFSRNLERSHYENRKTNLTHYDGRRAFYILTRV